MIDLIPYVAGLLAAIENAQIETSWQDTAVSFPLIIVSAPANTATTAGGAEVLTKISVQVDAFTLDKKSTVELAQSIDNIMIPAGLTRAIAKPSREDGLERFMLQYDAILDFTHENILI